MTEQIVTDRFTIVNADCVDLLRNLPANSIHYSIFSPPFSSLYTYSNSPRDMGNVRNDQEFFEHFSFLVDELMRVLKPGRLISFHCMTMPTSKERDGYIGLRDFRGDLLRSFQRSGFIYHSEVCIWKDPVTAMQRTHAKGLLYKELRKDSSVSRQGLPDYVVTVRKPGSNDEPVTKDPDRWPPSDVSRVGVERWQQYASPVWVTKETIRDPDFFGCNATEVAGDDSSGINPSNTLQYRSARENEDERHICPLQLSVIRRCVELWSNPNDVVLSPFAGIGSEGFVSLQMGRRFVGAELKGSYFRQAVKNLQVAAQERRELF